jgi:hypothetical protein
MSKNKFSIRQRKWTTGIENLVTSDPSLEDKVNRSNNVKRIGQEQELFFELSNVVLTNLGYLHQGKNQYPAVQDFNGEWYLVQNSPNLKPGKFYEGNIMDTPQDGFFDRLLRQFKGIFNGERYARSDSGIKASYNVKRGNITLDQATKLQRGKVPVYNGTHNEFRNSFGILKRRSPIEVTIDGDDEVYKIKRSLFVSENDYEALINYISSSLVNTTNNRLSISSVHQNNSESIKFDGSNRDKKVNDGKNMENISDNSNKFPTQQKQITEDDSNSNRPKYLDWLEIPYDKNIGKFNSEFAKKSLAHQLNSSSWNLKTTPDLDEMLESISDGNFNHIYSSVQVHRLEKMYQQKGKKNGLWAAYTLGEDKKINGVYLVVPNSRENTDGIVEVIREEGKSNYAFRENSPPSPISLNMAFWPNDELNPNDIASGYQNYLGNGSAIVIEGNVAVPQDKYEFEDIRVMGVLGMDRKTWRQYAVNKVALDYLESKKGENLEQGIISDDLNLFALSSFNNNPWIQEIATGGVESFAASVNLRMNDLGLSKSRYISHK